MAPVIKRIADGLSENLGPFKEFFLIGGIACDKAFLHSAGTHKTPLVVIAAKPYLGDIVEFAVFGNFSRVNMTVVIQNGHLFGILVKESLCSGSG